MPDLTPTAEQTAIVAAARDSTSSLMVNALAGTAKTTTAVMAAEAMKESGVSLTFNKKAQLELEKRLPKTWVPLTQNGLGHRAWSKAIGRRPELDDKKLGKLVSQISKPYQISQDEWGDVRKLVTHAMLQGVVPKQYPHKPLLEDTVENWMDLCDTLWIEPSERLVEIARKILVEDIRLGFQGIIHYDDQVYLSAMLGGVFPRYSVTILDEAQDLNLLNHIQVQRCSAGRILVFGDPKQSINAFRGAHKDSMEKIRAIRKDWIDLSLTTTFRCPHRIVERQQDHAPGFNAFETNHEGRVLNAYRNKLRSGEEHFGTVVETEPGEVPKRTWTWAEVIGLGHRETTILSRNNAQLISMAFKLLRQRVGCKMLGRDIGKSLLVLAKKLCPQDDMEAKDCALAITEWRDHQCDLAWANNHEEKVAGIRDRAESLLAVLEGSEAANAKALRMQIESLFSREVGAVTLSTIHKFKGLESELVVFLDPWRLPSRFAKKAAAQGNPVPLDQENNLVYVAETRVKKTLVLVNLEDFQ